MKKIGSLLCCLALILTLFSACGEEPNQQSEENELELPLQPRRSRARISPLRARSPAAFQQAMRLQSTLHFRLRF